MKIKKSCNKCKKEFESWKSSNRKYCSLLCRNKSYVGKKIIQNVSIEERLKRRQRMIGEKNPMWSGGDSDKERRNSEYKNWRINVFKRDNFTCQYCGYFNGCREKRRDLNAHHKIHWISSKELRYEVDNGVTFCVPCHKLKHKYDNY